MRVAVIDGQGGGIGKHIVEQLRKRCPDLDILALGTNAMAASAMLRAGANEVASGESAVVYNVERVDLILGSMGIMYVYGLLGEVSQMMAASISKCKAEKILLPIQKGDVQLVGIPRIPLPHLVEAMVDEVERRSKIS